MKKNILKSLLIVTIIAVTIFTSCRKLDETVYSSIFTSNYYKTAGDAEAALAATYASLLGLYNGPPAVLASDLSADQAYPRPVVGRNTLTLFSYDPEYSIQKSFSRADFEGPRGIWMYAYKGIENANWVIEKVPAIEMPAVRRNEIVGEALFLRAFYHFTLTRAFKDVIIKTSPSKTEADAIVAKSSQAQVFQQIFKDLDEAIPKLPAYSAAAVKGRATKEAAIALYAKSALYAGNWALAKTKAIEIINTPSLFLMPNVLDVYNVDLEDVARAENIFAFEGENNTARDHYSWLGDLMGPPNSAGRDYNRESFGSLFAYQTFFDSFNPNDRRRLLLDTSYTNRNNVVVPQKNITPITPQGVLIKKYIDKLSNGPRSRSNVPILRVADIYLIAAEAEFRLNGTTAVALEYINKVRRRAFGQLLNAPSIYDLTTLSESIILQERSWELCFEGDRWYDLTRTNTFLTAVPLAVNNVYPVRTPAPKHRYFPIPQDEIRANPKIVQSPGW